MTESGQHDTPPHAEEVETKGRAGAGQWSVAKKETPDYELLIEINNDFSACRVSCLPRKTAPAITPGDLLGILREFGVVSGINVKDVEAFCGAIGKSEVQKRVVLARAVPPQPAKNGSIEYLVKVSSKEPEYKETPDGREDFHYLHLFDNVAKDQPIARIHQPEEARDGINIMGQPIVLPKTQLTKAVVKRGPGVVMDDDMITLRASMDGRVIQEQNTLSVTDHYSVAHDVDFAVGHIDFCGFVEIRGDVLDGFNVRGAKGIDITGVVGACRIESDGDIDIRGGISGENKAVVRCGGNLSARFIDGAAVEATGNVVVKNEVINSIVKTAGAIVIENGTLAGGEHIALQGIEIRYAGTQIALTTELTAGADYRSVDQIRSLKKELETIARELDKCAIMLGPYLHNLQASARLTPEAKNHLQDLIAKVDGLKKRRDEINAILGTLQLDAGEKANPKINILSLLYAGCVIHLGNTVERITLEHNGPLSVIEDTAKGRFRFLPKTPLTVKAQDLEKKILAEEAEKERKARLIEEAKAAEEARRKKVEEEKKKKADSEQKRGEEQSQEKEGQEKKARSR